MSTSFARYPRPRLRPFLLEVFSAWGCRVESAPGIIEVRLTRPLQKRFGTKRLKLVLSRSARPSRKRTGELMVPGNPIYRSFLDLSRQKGAVGRGFLPMPKRRVAPSGVARAVGRAVDIEGATFRSVARSDVYHPVLLFHFSLSYGAPEVPDEIRTVAWDVVGGEAVDPSPFAPGGLSLAAGPAEGVPVAEVTGIDTVFPRVEAAIEAQISKKVSRTETRAKKRLDKERARIEGFYGRMIQEEKARSRSRNDGDPEASEKIKLYQLDWKRKLSEATERLRPRIEVRLFSIEEAFMPRRKAALIVAGSSIPERECFYDHTTREILGPSCDVCGSRSLEMSVCQNGHLCCRECVGSCTVCERPYCQQCWSESWDNAREGGVGGAGASVMAEMDPSCARDKGSRRRRNRK